MRALWSESQRGDTRSWQVVLHLCATSGILKGAAVRSTWGLLGLLRSNFHSAQLKQRLGPNV